MNIFMCMSKAAILTHLFNTTFSSSFDTTDGGEGGGGGAGGTKAGLDTAGVVLVSAINGGDEVVTSVSGLSPNNSNQHCHAISNIQTTDKLLINFAVKQLQLRSELIMRSFNSLNSDDNTSFSSDFLNGV